MEGDLGRNPSLENLDVLVGEWDIELSSASFLPNPDDKIPGHVGFEWIEDGALLLMRQGESPPPSPPLARWVIGQDEASPDYKVLYSDSRRCVSDLRDELRRWTLEDVAQHPRLLPALRRSAQ
jgi:hypothetical protein